MKAVGASNEDIRNFFIVESGMIGMAGGILGVGLGIVFAKTVEVAVAGLGLAILKASISPTLIIGALIFAFLVGVLAGVWPPLQILYH